LPSGSGGGERERHSVARPRIAHRHRDVETASGRVDREQGHSDLGWSIPVDNQKRSWMKETVDVHASGF
jgi:hypothetical protein